MCGRHAERTYRDQNALVAACPDYIKLQSSILSALLPLSNVWLSSLRALLLLSDSIWRLAGGLLSGKSATGMSAIVFGPDPDGGSRQVQRLEVLAPVDDGGLAAAAGRVKAAIQLWARIENGGAGLKNWLEGAAGTWDDLARSIEAGRPRRAGPLFRFLNLQLSH